MSDRLSLLSLKIVYEVFLKEDTIQGIARKVNANYKNVHDAVSALFKKGVLVKEKLGNYNICKLNYDNADIVEYLKEYNFYFRLKKFKEKYPKKYLKIKSMCEKNKNPFFICLIFKKKVLFIDSFHKDFDAKEFPIVFYGDDVFFRKMIERGRK